MKRILKFVLLVLILEPSCEKKMVNQGAQPIESSADFALRQFLEVKSLKGVIKVPGSQAAYLVTTLEFENGEIMRTGPIIHGETKYLSSRLFPAEFLWGETNAVSRTTLVAGGQTSWKTNDEFWGKLDGGWTQGGHHQFGDFTILGSAYSRAPAKGYANTGISGGTGNIRTKEFAGALAFKFFDSTEEMADYIEEIRHLK